MTKGNDSIHAETASIGNEDYGGKGIYYNGTGLTKREYFAAMAMQGIIVQSVGKFETIANLSVAIADALIEALNENQANE